MHRNRRWKKHGRRPDADRPRGSPGVEEDYAKPRPDLLVFGYASRIFKDNERATFFEKGRHLIPWMGDETLLIDRYDCRGHLHSLQPPDANRLPDGAIVGAELYGDRQFDELCDAERYRDLRILEEQQQMLVKQRHEVEMEEDYLAAIASPVSLEEESGENDSYGAVGFSYSDPSPPPKNSENSKNDKASDAFEAKEEKKIDLVPATPIEETPFVPREDFDIPAHISLPQFERIHSIIEKTALFIADKGPQLEIVIRSKQANNESFSFIQPKDALYPYYRFLVEAIKAGAYKPSQEKEPAPLNDEIMQEKEEPVESSSDEDDDYQTSLFSRLPAAQPREIVPARHLPAKPTVEFPRLANASSIYGSLIKKFQAGLNKPSEKTKEYPTSLLTVKSFSIKKPDPRSPRSEGSDRNGETVRVNSTDLSWFLPSAVERASKSDSRPSSSGPPPEVVTAVEKIANYVIKNGESFEGMIKARHAPDDPKFGFVHGYHPYHGLYMERKQALLNAFRHRLHSQKPTEEPSSNAEKVKNVISQADPQEETVVITPPQEEKIDQIIIPTPPPYSTPLQADPRIAGLKKKALEASLKIKQKIEEKEAIRVSLVQKALEETKKLAKEAVENEDEEMKVVMNNNRVVAGSFFELIHDETVKKEKTEKKRSRSRERRSRSREDRKMSKSKKDHKERRRRSPSIEREKERSSKHKEKKHDRNGTDYGKRRSRSRSDSERERTSKKSKQRRERR